MSNQVSNQGCKNFYHTHALTVDVEDSFSCGIADQASMQFAERRLEKNLNLILDIFDKSKVKGTFFWLGLTASEYPHLVKKVAEGGHEIGCHGWFHDPVYTMSPQRFKEETKRAADLISDISGKLVNSYRAPYCSIKTQCLWALEILAELGFRYDSSIFPVKHNYHKTLGLGVAPKVINTPSGNIYEMPVSVRKILGRNVPVSGGTFFRSYPYIITKSNFIALENQALPGVFYMHPYEMDVDESFNIKNWKDDWTSFINRNSTEHKLKRLLTDFSFDTLGKVVDDYMKTKDLKEYTV
jgi:polysaccharide deacetylase family protein (PEP-CTERM system associated)